MVYTSPGGGGGGYTAHMNKNCYNGHGGVEIDTNTDAPVGLSVDLCKERCTADAQCSCVTYKPSEGKCWKRAQCNPSAFADGYSTYDVYVKESGGSPPTPTPGTPPAPTPPTSSTCDAACQGSHTCRERTNYLRTDSKKKFEICTARHRINDMECRGQCECSHKDDGAGECTMAGSSEVRILQYNLYKWAAKDQSQNYKTLCEYIAASAKYGFDLAGFQEEWNVQNDCPSDSYVGASHFPAHNLCTDALYRSTFSDISCGASKTFKLNKKWGNAQNRYLHAAVCSKGGIEFVFGTSHWCIDWKGNGECSGSRAWNRDENAEESVKGLEELSGGTRPMIFTCDCNTNGGSAVRILEKNGFQKAAHSPSHYWGFDYIWFKNPAGAQKKLVANGPQIMTESTSREYSGPGSHKFHGSDHPGLFQSFIFQ